MKQMPFKINPKAHKMCWRLLPPEDVETDYDEAEPTGGSCMSPPSPSRPSSR
jgi:hypothetical protein